MRHYRLAMRLTPGHSFRINIDSNNNNNNLGSLSIFNFTTGGGTLKLPIVARLLLGKSDLLVCWLVGLAKCLQFSLGRAGEVVALD